MSFSVAHTNDLQRIADLPRREFTPEQLEYLADELTAILKKPGGTMRLFPQQAAGLHDAGVLDGLFGPLGVGDGKTLISLLASLVMRATRPMLLLPAALIPKTERERFELSKHWQIPNNIRLMSYELLSRDRCKDELINYRPDLLICDEAHRLKNRHAAVTRRVDRYMKHNPEARFVALSGTIMRKSLKDFAHVLKWCLKDKAPVPVHSEEVGEWAEALDENVDPMTRRDPGALLKLCTTEELRTYQPAIAIRHAFRRRLLETPGVVATSRGGDSTGASIYISGILYDMNPVTDENFRHLRGVEGKRDVYPGWRTPDGWDLMTAAEVWGKARELALGFHGIWDPRPPREWMDRRREWAAFVRETLSRAKKIDSEFQVARACELGQYGDEGKRIYTAWQKIKPTFTPCPRDIWHDESALEACMKWGKRPGIIWTEHVFFAEELSRRTGWLYYGQKGLTSDGHSLDDPDPKQTIIVSIDANREGRNKLVAYSRGLVTSSPPADWWQQGPLGRIHRHGQMADEIEVDLLLGCREHYDAFWTAMQDARAIRDTTGGEQKLLLADIEMPTESVVGHFFSPRWVKSPNR